MWARSAVTVGGTLLSSKLNRNTTWAADRPGRLRKDVRHHPGRLDPGQPLVEPLELVAEPQVVDPQAVEDGGVQVVDVDRAGDWVVAEVVGLPEHPPARHPAAGQPDAEVPRV